MIRPLIVLAALVLAVPASARDDRNLYPLDDALKSPNAQAKLDSGVALYFAGQKHPGVAKTMGEFRTNKKTNAVNKSDKEAPPSTCVATARSWPASPSRAPSSKPPASKEGPPVS